MLTYDFPSSRKRGIKETQQAVQMLDKRFAHLRATSRSPETGWIPTRLLPQLRDPVRVRKEPDVKLEVNVAG